MLVSDLSVNAVSSWNYLPRIYTYVDGVSKIIDMGDGQHKVQQTNYVTTVYDVNGQLSTSQSNHQINYLI